MFATGRLPAFVAVGGRGVDGNPRFVIADVSDRIRVRAVAVGSGRINYPAPRYLFWCPRDNRAELGGLSHGPLVINVDGLRRLHRARYVAHHRLPSYSPLAINVSTPSTISDAMATDPP